MAMLIADKSGFRAKIITREGVGHCKVIKGNPPRWHNNPKYVCIKQQNYKICEQN